MKKFSVIPVFIASLLATQALAGTLTVSGSLNVTTNLTAQSITLGSVTETNCFTSDPLDRESHGTYGQASQN